MSTRLTVGETLKKIEHLTLKQAALDEAAEHLAQFIATDSYEPTKGISSPLSADVVPQEIISEVKDELLVKRVEYETKIQELKGQSVSATAKAAKKAPVKKATRKAPPKRRKTSAKGKQQAKGA